MRSENLTIILPAKIGDIIICLPIAKYYYQQGYNVHWPVYDFLISNFIKGHINYVNFVPIRPNNPIVDSKKYANSINSKVLDLSFSSPGSWNNENDKKFLSPKEISFDEFRYKLSRVDFDEKWNLDINRIKDREQQLFNHLVSDEKYVIYQFQGSDRRKEIKLDNRDNLKLIEVKPYTDCVFDWIYTLENAEYLVLIDSCFTNLVDQLSLSNKKFFIKRSDFTRTPKMRSEWTVID